MKTSRSLMLIVFFTFLSNLAAHAGDTLSLKEAIRRNLVKAVIHGTKQSPKAMLSHAYYGECLMVELQNLTDSTLNLKLETGQTLDCNSDPVQNLIITKQLAIKLKGGKKTKEKAYAMCIQQHKQSPDENTTFRVGKMANGNLLKFSKVIEQYNYQDYAGQQAMWVFTDNNDTASVVADDIAETRLLRRYIAMLKFNADIDLFDYSGFKGEPKIERKQYVIAGKMIWEMNKGGNATLQIFDEDGNVFATIFEKKHFRKGEQTQNFTYSSDKIVKGKSYTAKLKIKGVIKEEMSCLAE